MSGTQRGAARKPMSLRPGCSTRRYPLDSPRTAPRHWLERLDLDDDSATRDRHRDRFTSHVSGKLMAGIVREAHENMALRARGARGFGTVCQRRPVRPIDRAGRCKLVPGNLTCRAKRDLARLSFGPMNVDGDAVLEDRLAILTRSATRAGHDQRQPPERRTGPSAHAWRIVAPGVVSPPRAWVVACEVMRRQSAVASALLANTTIGGRSCSSDESVDQRRCGTSSQARGGVGLRGRPLISWGRR